jgi:hypothetical protein
MCIIEFDSVWGEWACWMPDGSCVRHANKTVLEQFLDEYSLRRRVAGAWEERQRALATGVPDRRSTGDQRGNDGSNELRVPTEISGAIRC